MYLNEIYFCSNYDLIYMILDNLTIFWLWYIEFLFLLYYWFQVKDYYKYILIPSIWFLHIYLNKIYSFWKLWFHVYDYEQFDYELILIPSQWGLFIGTLIPSQWGLFIGTLIPKPMGGFIHWYSDTQINEGLFIGTLIPSQWGLSIGILIPKPMRVIHWYFDTQTNGSYSLVLWCPIMEI